MPWVLTNWNLMYYLVFQTPRNLNVCHLMFVVIQGASSDVSYTFVVYHCDQGNANILEELGELGSVWAFMKFLPAIHRKQNRDN